jgi:pilus assembly protein CpaB
MDSNQTRTLWISLGAGLLAVILLYSWMQEQRNRVAVENGARTRVVFATQDINEMQDIHEGLLEIRDVPETYKMPGAIQDPDLAVGQVAAVPIKKGEQLVETKLVLKGPETGLSMEVSPGRRAITIPIDDSRGVSRLIRPGDRIDLLANISYGRGTEAKVEVKTLLQDVVVLAAGTNVMNKIPRRMQLEADGRTVTIDNLTANTNFSSMTIEVKPDEAPLVVYMLSTNPGNLFAVLRHPNDRLQQPMRTVTVEDILQRGAMVRAPTAAPPAPVAPMPVAAPPPQQRPANNNGRFRELRPGG